MSKKKKANNSEVKAGEVVKKSAVIQTARVKIDGFGDGRLTLRGLYYTEGDGHPEVYVVEFFIDSKGYTTALRCFDRFMDAWRSYRRFVCLSNEGGRK